MHDVAGVHLAQPDPSADRGDDAAIGQVQLLRVDLGLVGLDRAAILLDERGLSVEGLSGDRVLRHQRLVARKIELGIFKDRLVLGQLALGLGASHP